MTACLNLFYFRKRKSGYDIEQVDAGKISEKDRMLKEKEAEVFPLKVIVKSYWCLSLLACVHTCNSKHGCMPCMFNSLLTFFL